LDVQILSDDLRTNLADFLADRTGSNFCGTRILKNAAAFALRKLKSRAALNKLDNTPKPTSRL
jgi:hypothetical protein